MRSETSTAHATPVPRLGDRVVPWPCPSTASPVEGQGQARVSAWQDKVRLSGLLGDTFPVGGAAVRGKPRARRRPQRVCADWASTPGRCLRSQG